MARMKTADYARLIALAAIWGASFIFTRVIAPSLGAVWTAELRVLLGGAALLAWFRLAGFDAGLRRHWRYYLAVGTVNSALPFALYAYAAIHLPASLLAIVNATSPMFGMLFGALAGTERVTANVLAVALLASAVAFLIYFRLIADVGATRALTVTFLIPPFGVLWGWLFLDEALPAGMLGGGILIVSGTVLVTRS
jgi:drug/metabolite transporter (DMT)-like permease